MENVTRKTRPASGKWILAFAMTLLFQLTAVAQDFPSEFIDDEDDNPTDQTLAAPIVDYVWVLVVIGICFAFYKYKKNSKQTHSNLVFQE
jgi:hypothetical protein